MLAALLVAAAALYPLSHVGFRDALQALLQSFDIAVEQYARVSGTHWYDLELTATDNLTLERIRCRCPVVGTWKNGFIVLHQDPASYRGGILRLHYARAAELGPWLDLVAVRGEVVVQFWLMPGEAAVTRGAGEEREVERIPAQLRRFL